MSTKTLDYYLSKEAQSAEYTQRQEFKNRVASFHENTKMTLALKPTLVKSISHHLSNNAQIYLDSRNKKSYVFSVEKKLPKPHAFEHSFEEVLQKRATDTKFKPQPLSEQELSNLLSSIRATRVTTSSVNKNAIIHQRSYASAGALFPVEIYAFLPNENHSTWSCCNYDPRKHSVTILNKNISKKQIAHALQRKLNQVACGAIVVLSGVFNRSVDKYGPIGYRFGLIEAGGIIQQLGLAGASMNLSTLTWGGALDDEVNKLLKIDGLEENYLISFIVGHK
ncbi:SagB/ThcOx family dehydrogenase [Aquimarina agarivorans]|uniref:SagB/ThcOx family dehydrogenase n=1 Tax=Aquimarina agarivorans TaxID=980584 RepID=UPI000248F307|nr:SagB/ThcOx family dehydrogenase [Aquimarina agarivorans]